MTVKPPGTASFVAVLPVLSQLWRIRLGARHGIGGDLVMTWRPTGRAVASVALAETFGFGCAAGSGTRHRHRHGHCMAWFAVWFFLRNRWRRSVAPDDAHGSLGGGRVWAVASGGPIGVWLKCIVKRGGRVATADVAFTHTPITTCVFVVSVIPSYQNISPWRQIT